MSNDIHSKIDRLLRDMVEYGAYRIMYVITENVNGKTIYKDYEVKNGSTSLIATGSEDVAEVCAATLLDYYREQNKGTLI